jgi:predicted DNA-binding transcriptional regulator YafY
MKILQDIKKAIDSHHLINIVYVKREDDTFYSRKVEPCALYIHPTTNNILLDAFQWCGDSDTKKQWTWKRFDVTKMRHLKITDRMVKRVRKEYNPTSERYVNAICMLKGV